MTWPAGKMRAPDQREVAGVRSVGQATVHLMLNYSLWDSSEISLKHGSSSGQSFSVKNPYFLSKW